MGLSGVSNDSNCEERLIIHRMIRPISASQSHPTRCVRLDNEVRWPDYIQGGKILKVCRWNHPNDQNDDGRVMLCSLIVFVFISMRLLLCGDKSRPGTNPG